MNGMDFYSVVYRGRLDAFGEPLVFQCWASDTDHAEEQFRNAEGDGPEILWTHCTAQRHPADDAVDAWRHAA